MSHEDTPPRLVKLSAPAIAVALLVILSHATLGEEAMEFSYPAGRRAYVSGEKIRVWLHLPPRARGSGELALSTQNGIITRIEEALKEPQGATTLAYLVDSGLLSPGRYVLQFRLGKSECESVFNVINGVPATHFTIAVDGAAPQTPPEAARFRDLHFNTVLITDTKDLNGDALARAGVRWLRQLPVEAGSSPADPDTLIAGARRAQVAAQAAKGSWGFSGIALSELQPPGSMQTIDLISIFRDKSERRLAAMSLLTAASGQVKATAELVAKLKPSPAGTLLAGRLRDFLLAKRFDKTLEANARDIAERIEKKQAVDVPAEVRRLLDARKMAIYKMRLADPFADAHVVAAYRRRYGASPPPWWEGNRNWEQWQQYLDLRAGLWPSAVQAWSKAAKAIDPTLVFGGVARCSANDQVDSAADIKICRVVVSPSLGSLQPLFEAALAGKDNTSAAIWMRPHPSGQGVGGLRGTVYGSLVSGASGIVYPARSALPDRDLHAAAESASLNNVITRYGDFLLALERKPSKVAVLDSRTAYLHDLGMDPLEQKGRSRYRGKLAAAWAACAWAGFVPKIIEEDSEFKQYSVVLAPALQRLPEKVAEALVEFIGAGGTVIVDNDCKVAIEGVIRLPFAFPATPPNRSIARELAQRIGKPLYRAAGQDLISSRKDFLIREFQAEGPARFFWIIRLSEAPPQATTEISLPRNAGPVYDVLASAEAKIISSEDDTGPPSVRVALGVGEAKLFAILPRPIGSVALAEPLTNGKGLSISAGIFDDGGKAIATVVPASIAVLDEAGAERFRVYRCFKRGKLQITFPLGMNEPPGRWFVRVTELFSRRSQGTAFTMPGREPVDVVRPLGPADVFARKHCTKLLRRARSLALIAGKGRSRKAAQDLARGLQRFAINCEIHQDSDLQNGGAALAEDVVLLGNSRDNVLIRRLHDLGLVPVDIAERGPGNGRAVVFWSLSALRPGKETITIWADDAEGLARGAEALLEMCSGRDPEAPSRSVKARDLRATPPATAPPPPVLAPALSFELADSITGVAAPSSGRFFLASSRLGEICALTSRGEEAWRVRRGIPIRSLLLPANGANPLVCFAGAAERFSIVSTTKWRFDLSDTAQPETIATACLSTDGTLALLGTSAGRVMALDETGSLKWRTLLGGPVTALAAIDGKVAAADARKVVFLNERGARVQEEDFPDCCSLAFSTDSRTLVAGSRSGLVRRLSVGGRSAERGRKLPGAIKGIIQTLDGRALAVAEGGAIVQVGPGDKPIAFHLGHNVQIVAEAPDRKWFAAASLGGTVSVFDASGILRQFSISDAPISSMAIASDARLLIVGDWGGTVNVFSID